MGARSLGGQDPDTGGDQGCVERTGRRPRGAPSAGHGRRACCVGRRLSAIVSRGGSDAASDIAARRGGGWIWDRKWRARILPDKSRYRAGPSLSSRPQAMLAYNPKNMTEDEREHLLSTVGQAHAGLSEVALKLRLGLPPKTSVLKTAIKAERVAFDLKRSLQRLEVKDVETITRRAPVLPEVRRGGKVVDPESLLRHENRHDERLTGLPRRNTPRRSG